jgi:hypothetical protein
MFKSPWTAPEDGANPVRIHLRKNAAASASRSSFKSDLK